MIEFMQGNLGAVLVDVESRGAFPYLFQGIEEARAFHDYCGRLDLRYLDWGICERWLRCGKPARVEVPGFNSFETMGLKSGCPNFCFSLDPEDLFPFFQVKYGEALDLMHKQLVNEVLFVPGVKPVIDLMLCDSRIEFFFILRKDCSGFLDRLNAWLKLHWHEAYADVD